jgi:hypothetical protein
MFLGGFIGFKLKHSRYDGIITMKENDGKLIYSLMVANDPELLANQKEARFKIIPPTYEVSRE